MRKFEIWPDGIIQDAISRYEGKIIFRTFIGEQMQNSQGCGSASFLCGSGSSYSPYADVVPATHQCDVNLRSLICRHSRLHFEPPSLHL
jgi:hypothetical protein